MKPLSIIMLLQKGGPLPGPESGLLSNTRNGLSKEVHILTKLDTLLGRGTWAGNPGGLLCCVACCLMFCVDEISFWVVFGQSFWLRVLPGGSCIAQPRWMLARGILGGGWTRSVSFWPFLNSSSWWWLIPCSLPGPPVVKQLTQMITREPGQGGQFRPVCFP